MIVEVSSTGKKTTIGELHGGDCFYFWQSYYMKLPITVEPSDDDEKSYNEFNSVRLSDGDLMLIGERDEIVPVKAVVTIDLKKS